VYPILFSIGQVNFYTHGLMIAIGCLVGGLTIFGLARREKLPTKFLFDLIVFSLFAGLIGARIAYVVLYYYQFQNWHEMFFIWYGGLVSFGGLIFGFLAAWLILKRRKQNILKWFDVGIIGLLFGWGFGRIGCFLSGDTPGIISDSWLAIQGEIPVSLFEAIWVFVLAGALLYLSHFNFIKKFGDGFIFFVGVGGYALGRFAIDFIREENIFYFLRGGQIASLSLFIFVLIILIFKYFLAKSKNSVLNGEREKDA